MNKWQPIETYDVLDAPVDVLVAVPAIRHPEMKAYYAVGEARLYDKDGWYWAGNNPHDSWGNTIYPTHWMPMPEGPESAPQKGVDHG